MAHWRILAWWRPVSLENDDVLPLARSQEEATSNGLVNALQLGQAEKLIDPLMRQPENISSVAT